MKLQIQVKMEVGDIFRDVGKYECMFLGFFCIYVCAYKCVKCPKNPDKYLTSHAGGTPHCLGRYFNPNDSVILMLLKEKWPRIVRKMFNLWFTPTFFFFF